MFIFIERKRSERKIPIMLEIGFNLLFTLDKLMKLFSTVVLECTQIQNEKN